MRRFLLILLAAAPAWANGRFPASTSISFHPTDANTMLLGTTFGLVITRDGGNTWSWVCEVSVHYGGTFDPAYAVTPTGTMLAGVYSGLSVSRDGGCSWTLMLPDEWVNDVQVGADGAVWAVTASAGRPNDVYVSRNDGVSFDAQHLPEPVVWWRDVRPAPSDPTRVYVAGYRLVASDAGSASQPVVYRLTGTTWTPLAVDVDVPLLRLLAVDPQNRDVVYAHVQATEERLLRSVDGGGHWETVFVPPTQVQAFAARGDGALFVTGTSFDRGQVWTSSNGTAWTPASQQPRLACAGVDANGKIFGCGYNWTPDFFALGTTTDGQSWTKVFRIGDLGGPLACPAGSPQQLMCEPLWPALAQMLMLGAVDAGTPDAPAPPPSPNGKCGCNVSLVLVFLPLARRRRRDLFGVPMPG